MQDVRIIKKYPNRRLYDTAISAYITLDDVKKLVIDCANFKIIDARSTKDLTHATLLQIISEQEEAGAPLLTRQILQHIIRFYGHARQGLMSDFLEKNLDTFVQKMHITQPIKGE